MPSTMQSTTQKLNPPFLESLLQKQSEIIRLQKEEIQTLLSENAALRIALQEKNNVVISQSNRSQKLNEQGKRQPGEQNIKRKARPAKDAYKEKTAHQRQLKRQEQRYLTILKSLLFMTIMGILCAILPAWISGNLDLAAISPSLVYLTIQITYIWVQIIRSANLTDSSQ